MSVARFAGDEMEKMLGHGVDFGALGERKSYLEGKEGVADIQGDSYVQRAGITAKADVESAKLTGQAQSKLASAQAQGSMFSSLGSSLGGALGGLGSKTSFGTNRGVSPYSQPHASGIGREALGGYDL